MESDEEKDHESPELSEEEPELSDEEVEEIVGGLALNLGTAGTIRSLAQVVLLPAWSGSVGGEYGREGEYGP